jgi:hypothetical protein
MKNNYLQLSALWKKGTTLTLGLGLLSGGMSTQAAIDCNAVTEISTVECESLLELYHNTNGADWGSNHGWNVTNTPCSWYGITCENGGVTEIDSGGLYTGYAYIGPMIYEHRNIYSNNLNGTLPNFSGLPNLQKLDLSYNYNLTGAIPDFSALPHLKYLDLSGNNQLCKDININYSSWQEKVNAFPNCPVATDKMQLNQSRYTTSNRLRLDMQINGQGMVDLYVAIVFPDGDFMTIAYPLALSWPNVIQIYQPAVEIAGQKTYSIMEDFPLPAGLTTGNYHVCGVLVLAGANHTENNWIDSHCAGFEVY